MEFVTLAGRQFILGQKPLHLHGVGLGSWLNLEHFMIGIPGLDGAIRRTMEQCYPGAMAQFTRSFFTDEDAAYLKRIGINFLRVPLNHRLFWDDEKGVPREEGLQTLRDFAAVCERHQLFFMPDLHTTPGGQNPDWHCENETGVPLFWSYRVLQDSAVQIWRHIAEALQDSPQLLGYDLLNEPVLPSRDIASLNAFYQRTAEAIDTVDGRHLMLLEGQRFAMDFRGLALPHPQRCCYTYHYYPGVWEPRLSDPALPRAERIAGFRRAHQSILNTMEGYDGPLLCGEAGVELKTLGEAEGVAQLRDTLDVFDAEKASWCLWSYKDTGMMGLRVPGQHTGWQTLCSRMEKHWNHHLDMERGQALAEWISRTYALHMTEDEIYRMQFRLRAALFDPETNHLLRMAAEQPLPVPAQALGESFALANCSERALYRQLLESACAQYHS